MVTECRQRLIILFSEALVHEELWKTKLKDLVTAIQIPSMILRLTIKSINKVWMGHPNIPLSLVEPIQINPNGMTATSSVVKSTTSNGFLTQELQISRSTTSLVIGFLILQTLTVQEKTKPNLKQLQLIRPTTQPTPLQIQLSPDSMTMPKLQSTLTSWAKKCQSKKVEQEISQAEQSKVPKLSS